MRKERIPSTERIFYVYHHLNENPTIGELGCRYIGKGKGNRAFTFRRRNPHWHYIFTKENRPTVVLIAKGLTEEEAFAIEIQQIAFAKEHGVKLCNLTEGGDGASGCKRSPETCQKLSARIVSNETREKLSIASKKQKGRPVSNETKEKLSMALRKWWNKQKNLS